MVADLSLAPVLAELERLYDAALMQWPRLKTAARPVITLASRGRKATVNSWYIPGVWRDTDEDVLSFLAEQPYNQIASAEIVVATEVLVDPVQTVAELVKQMVAHRYERLRPAPGSFYYSEAWRDHAYQVECMAEVNAEQPSKGWSQWTPRPKFVEWAQANVNMGVFHAEREGAAKVKVGSRMKKWTCGCTVVRSATLLRATCTACNNRFHWAEAEPFPFAIPKGHAYGTYDPRLAEPETGATP